MSESTFIQTCIEAAEKEGLTKDPIAFISSFIVEYTIQHKLGALYGFVDADGYSSSHALFPADAPDTIKRTLLTSIQVATDAHTEPTVLH